MVDISGSTFSKQLERMLLGAPPDLAVICSIPIECIIVAAIASDSVSDILKQAIDGDTSKLLTKAEVEEARQLIERCRLASEGFEKLATVAIANHHHREKNNAASRPN